MTIEDLNARFKWTPDGKVDSFRILSGAGQLEGDCDDYAATALWLVEGRSMWRFWWAVCTFKAVFWLVKGRTFASHVVLYHRDYGWIDNQNPTWGPNRDKLRMPFLPPVVALKMLLGKFA